MAKPAADHAESPSDKPPRRRWQWPLALKMFVAFLAILSFVGGWIIWRGYEQLAAIEKIEHTSVGGMKGWVTCEPIGPTWLRDGLGAERMRMFDRVTAVQCFLESPDPKLVCEIGCWSHLKEMGIFFFPKDQSRLQSLKTLSEVRQVVSQWAEQNREMETGFQHFHGFDELMQLGFHGPSVTDRDLDWLENLTNLNLLILEICPITDVTVYRIRTLKKLVYLRVPVTLITDDGLRPIGELTSLKTLDLAGTQVTDAGLTQLQNLTELEDLHLQGTEVTSAGLARLSSFSKLNRLEFEAEKIDDEGLRHISALPHLTSLHLQKSPITDAGLEHLQSMENLEDLHLDGTAITDAGLRILKKMTNLKGLSVNDTKVTAAGVAELKLALPELHINHSTGLGH